MYSISVNTFEMGSKTLAKLYVGFCKANKIRQNGEQQPTGCLKFTLQKGQTGKKAKPSNNSAVCAYLHHCKFLPSFDNFFISAHVNKKYLLEVKESLLIMRDKPSLNRNINSAPSHLFDKVSKLVLASATLV